MLDGQSVVDRVMHITVISEFPKPAIVTMEKNTIKYTRCGENLEDKRKCVVVDSPSSAKTLTPTL